MVVKIGAWHEALNYFAKETGSILGSTTEKAVTTNDLYSTQCGGLCNPILG